MLRKATLEDLEQLLMLRMALIRSANGLMENEDLSMLYQSNYQYIQDELNKGIFIWVVEEQGEIVGTIGLNLFQKPPTYTNPSGREAYIMNVYVKEEYRGRGYGTQLVRTVLNYCEERGYEKVDIVATKEGKPLYLKLGFKEKERVMEYSVNKEKLM